MAKTKERKALKKGKATFNLIGRVKVTDKTFNLDNSYDSGWTDNSMYVGVDCGNGNTVYAEMRSGFFPDKDNVIRAYSKDEKDDAGKSKSVEIAWEDRLDESLYDSISDSSFLTVGVEKDVKDKTVYKKFLTAYDAVEYLNEHLEDGMIVNVKGTIGYSEYEGNVSTKKEITSIVLSKIDDEADFKATFSQTILVDSKSIGKKNDDKGTIELAAYVVDYVGKPKIDGEKIEVKKNVTYPKTFEIAINENPEITAKMLQRFFKPKKGKITEITVTGNLVEGGSTVNITEDDKMTMVTANGETKFDYERRSDGIEVKMEGKDEIYMSMAYDKDKKTLTYKLDLGNGQTMEVVLEKGKADMTPVQQDAQTQTDGAVEEGATEAAQ